MGVIRLRFFLWDGASSRAYNEMNGCLDCDFFYFFQAKGTPTPEVLWFKGEKPVRIRASHLGIFNDGTELRISNIRESDLGDYTCIARNGEGRIHHITKVVMAGTLTRYFLIITDIYRSDNCRLDNCRLGFSLQSNQSRVCPPLNVQDV